MSVCGKKAMRWLVSILAGLITLAVCLVPARAMEEVTREQQVKAAFVYNFMQFVEWPAQAFDNPQAPIIVASVDGADYGEALEGALAGKAVNQHPIIVRRYPSVDKVEAGCHVLVLASDDGAAIAAARAKLGGAPVLLVGEGPGFCAHGGLIRLFKEDGRMRFEINPKAAERVGLKIAAKLLKLASIYEGRD